MKIYLVSGYPPNNEAYVIRKPVEATDYYDLTLKLNAWLTVTSIQEPSEANPNANTTQVFPKGRWT